MFMYDGKIFVTANPSSERGTKNHKHWLNVLTAFELEIQEKGFSEYYCMVDNPISFRWCVFFGFRTINEIVGGQVEVMKKEILI